MYKWTNQSKNITDGTVCTEPHYHRQKKLINLLTLTQNLCTHRGCSLMAAAMIQVKKCHQIQLQIECWHCCPRALDAQRPIPAQRHDSITISAQDRSHLKLLILAEFCHKFLSNMTVDQSFILNLLNVVSFLPILYHWQQTWQLFTNFDGHTKHHLHFSGNFSPNLGSPAPLSLSSSVLEQNLWNKWHPAHTKLLTGPTRQSIDSVHSLS